MEAGTLPPNWQELIEHSSEIATTKDVFKADTCLSDQQIVDATDQLTGQFAIVPDQHKKQRPQRRASNKITSITEHAFSKGDRLPHSSPPPHYDLTSHAAANLFDINGCENIVRSGAAKNTGRPNQIADLGVQKNLYAMPENMNPHENNLLRYPRLREQREKDKEAPQKRKVHVSFGTATATKLGFGLFSLIALATNIVVPQHQTKKNATFNQQVMNRFHEVNDLYDGTLNEVHHVLYATGISSLY